MRIFEITFENIMGTHDVYIVAKNITSVMDYIKENTAEMNNIIGASDIGICAAILGEDSNE